MPILSRFHGIVVRMYYNDHNPPHFHVSAGGEEALVDIESTAIIAGSVSSRTNALINQWADQHRDALRDNWQRMRTGQPAAPIPPLD